MQGMDVELLVFCYGVNPRQGKLRLTFSLPCPRFSKQITSLESMSKKLRKHRTPIVQTIRLSFGEHSSIFRLEKESLVQRTLAIRQLTKLHALAKAFIAKEPVVLDEQAPATCSDLFHDIHSELPEFDWDNVTDLSNFMAMPETIPAGGFEPFDMFSLVENKEPPP
jgi:hypothetical protein